MSNINVDLLFLLCKSLVDLESDYFEIVLNENITIVLSSNSENILSIGSRRNSHHYYFFEVGIEDYDVSDILSTVYSIVDKINHIKECDECKAVKLTSHLTGIPTGLVDGREDFLNRFSNKDLCKECIEDFFVYQDYVEENCPICLEPLGSFYKATTTCCHLFHKRCFNKIEVEDEGLRKCPLCRELTML